MGRFNAPQAAEQDPQPTVDATNINGIDLHIRFKPTDTVWYLTQDGAKSERVIRIKTEHRSIVSTAYKPEHRITLVMESGTERREDECFASKAELAEWILNN